MNRIGGPSALPHSRRAAAGHRRPPCGSFSSARPLSSRPPRVRRVDRIVAVEGLGRICRAVVFFAVGLPILRPPDAYERFRAPGRRGDTAWMEAPAIEVFVGRERELGQLERALDATRAAAARRRSSPGRRASARPGWRRSWRRAPATRGSRSCSGARSTWSARNCRTNRSSRPCARWERSRRSTRRRRAPSCACSSRRWRCCTTARTPRRCCWYSRTCTGPTPPRSIWSSSSPTTSAAGGCCCWRPTVPTSPPRPRACARLADGVRRSGSALVLELGPLDREELTTLLAAHADALPPADGRDRCPLRRQPLLRRGAAGHRRPAWRAAAWPARPAAAA